MTACPATYRPSHFGVRDPGVEVTCVHHVDADGRHIASHQGYEDMPAGERTNALTKEVEAWGPWQRLWTWTSGGAQGLARERSCMVCTSPAYRGLRTHTQADHVITACGHCGALHDPLGYSRHGDHPDAPSDWCFSCRLWWHRVKVYCGDLPAFRNGHRREQRLLVPHPGGRLNQLRLYCWSPGVSGAFGDWKVTVRWDDGDQVGPASCLWGSGQIPWWLTELFPPNGRLVLEDQR